MISLHFKIINFHIADNVVSFHKDVTGNCITEGTFNTALSAAFSNSKDWGGRQKKN